MLADIVEIRLSLQSTSNLLTLFNLAGLDILSRNSNRNCGKSTKVLFGYLWTFYLESFLHGLIGVCSNHGTYAKSAERGIVL
jgi:hypothetical protein